MLWKLAKPLLFKLDPEHAHELAINCLKWSSAFRKALVAGQKDKAGINFSNPVGLAAGMDKNGKCLMGWQSLGFGFVEVGTVTAQPQIGNPKPRLFRQPTYQSLFNRMGFNNDGARVVSERVALQRKSSHLTIPIGMNIGKSAVVALEDAAQDYLVSFDLVADVADYVVINVSSPNTKNLRLLQESEALTKVLAPITDRNAQRVHPRPVLVKIAPDMDKETALKIAKTALENGVSGLIISNTSTQPLIPNLPTGGGGLSGRPIFTTSTELLARVRQEIGPKPLLIGSGGVMSGLDAVEKIKNGADVVQIYTGFVYGGPNFPRACVHAINASKLSHTSLLPTEVDTLI